MTYTDCANCGRTFRIRKSNMDMPLDEDYLCRRCLLKQKKGN
jgi:DNA-directed RNA polymerase subunit RPC12/RpoP